MNIDIKSIAKTIIRKNQGIQDPQLIYPARDWAVGVVGMLVTISIAVAWTVWQYRSYTNVSLDEEIIPTMLPYRTLDVEQAIAKYQVVETNHKKIIEAATVSLSRSFENGVLPPTPSTAVEELGTVITETATGTASVEQDETQPVPAQDASVIAPDLAI